MVSWCRPAIKRGQAQGRTSHEPLSLRDQLARVPSTIDPAEITDIFGHVPSHAWQAGTQRATPAGRPLSGTRDHSYWTARLTDGEWPGKTLAAAIGEILDALASRREDLARLRGQGAGIELFVGWFCDGNSGAVLDCALMARMAELNLDLSLDLYP
jgi:hypothetical protein